MSSSTPTRPAPARPTWRSRSRSRPARPATASQFATATEWVARLEQAQHRNAPRRRAAAPGALQPARRRRDRLPPARPPSRQPALRARRAPLRTRLDHRHQQQKLRGLGRDPRRRHGRRRADRPARPPRPHPHAQGQELPTPRKGHRRRAGGRDPARRPTADDLNHGHRPDRPAHYSLPDPCAVFGSC